MGAIVLALTWACATGIITTASRMTWSFSRDKGTPFSSVVSYVSKTRRIPTVAVLVVTGIAALLTLIYIGSDTAFNDVISLTITGFYSSYFLPAAFLLYNRVKGRIQPHNQQTPGLPVESDDMSDDNAVKVPISNGDSISSVPRKNEAAGADDDDIKKTAYTDAESSTYPPAVNQDRRFSIAEAPLVWGPFHLPGWFGIINNAYACLYMIFVIFWSVWPPATPVNYQTMNYSVVVTGGVIIFSVIWYYIRGHKEYKGPIVDDEVAAIVVRRGSVGGV